MIEFIKYFPKNMEKNQLFLNFLGHYYSRPASCSRRPKHTIDRPSNASRFLSLYMASMSFDLPGIRINGHG